MKLVVGDYLSGTLISHLPKEIFMGPTNYQVLTGYRQFQVGELVKEDVMYRNALPVDIVVLRFPDGEKFSYVKSQVKIHG